MPLESLHDQHYFGYSSQAKIVSVTDRYRQMGKRPSAIARFNVVGRHVL